MVFGPTPREYSKSAIAMGSKADSRNNLRQK
jgi:hypothetical protein